MTLFSAPRLYALCNRLLEGKNEKGEACDSKHGRELLSLLQAIGGVRPVGRSARYALTPPGRTYLMAQLARVEPAELTMQHSMSQLGITLPTRLNQACFYALLHGDSKYARQPRASGSAEGDIQLTQDEVIRLRTLDVLSVTDQQGQWQDMSAVMTLLGEVALPERALHQLAAVDWQGQQVITIENKGAFIDYPLEPGQLLLFTPGRNTTLAKVLIPLLSADIPWAHFGDLDQRGIDIAIELAAALSRPARLWLPAEIDAYVTHYARPLPRFDASSGKIPWRLQQRDKLNDDTLTWLGKLVTQARWLEQEVLICAGNWRSWDLNPRY
ncbi:MAG: Wadjet anti-phage system protein JetD domain-containing protein [Aeromonas sp.]